MQAMQGLAEPLLVTLMQRMLTVGPSGEEVEVSSRTTALLRALSQDNHRLVLRAATDTSGCLSVHGLGSYEGYPTLAMLAKALMHTSASIPCPCPEGPAVLPPDALLHPFGQNHAFQPTPCRAADAAGHIQTAPLLTDCSCPDANLMVALPPCLGGGPSSDEAMRAPVDAAATALQRLALDGASWQSNGISTASCLTSENSVDSLASLPLAPAPPDTNCDIKGLELQGAALGPGQSEALQLWQLQVKHAFL
jgi:hypothetical protein